MDLDLETLSDEELYDLSNLVQEEVGRRSALANMNQQMDDLIGAHNDAVGRDEGDEWTHPTHAIDSYLLDAVVTHNGQEWINEIPYNVWEPGVAGWAVREEDPVDPDPTDPEEPEIPDWAQPGGAGDVYSAGDLVRFEGEVYMSLIDNNSYSPATYPAGWELQTE